MCVKSDMIDGVLAFPWLYNSTMKERETMGIVHGGMLEAQILKREGVEVVFTLSGGHIAAIYDGCLREGIRVVDTRHEQAAVHAAEGWAKCTRTPGVALLTAGPGVTDGVTGVANAYLAGSPVLVIGGAAPLG